MKHKTTNRLINAWKEYKQINRLYRHKIYMNTNDKWIEQTKSNGLEPKEKARHGMTWNGGTKTRQTNEMAWHRMEKKAVGMEWNGMEWKE